MKMTLLLTLIVLFSVFSDSVFAQKEPFDDLPLITKPNRALKDVKEVSVIVTADDSEPNRYGLNTVDLKNRVIKNLSDAGFGSVALYSSAIPNTLRIHLNMLKIEPCGQCVVSVQTSFLRGVSLSDYEQLNPDYRQ